MTELFRMRIEPKTLAEAGRVCGYLGTSTPEIVRIFLAEVANTGRIPLKLDQGEQRAERKLTDSPRDRFLKEFAEAWSDFEGDTLTRGTREAAQNFAERIKGLLDDLKQPAGKAAAAEPVKSQEGT